VVLLGSALLAAGCAAMSAPNEIPTQGGTPPSGASLTPQTEAPSLIGRWRVMRLDVRGAPGGQRDFALAVSTKYPPPDGRAMRIGMNGMAYIRERSMSYSDAWITEQGQLNLWWGAGPDKGVLPTLTGWAGKGSATEGAFRFTDWPGQIVFARNADGTVTFQIPWTRTTATIERAAEPTPRSDLRVSALILRFDDGKSPAPEAMERPRATLLWERPVSAALSTEDQPLSFRPGPQFERASLEVNLPGPPPEPALSKVDGVRFAVAHVIVYDDVDGSAHFEHPLVGATAARDRVRAISNVAILWRGPERWENEPAGDPFIDTWPGYELVTIGPDGRSTIGHTPWVPERELFPTTAGALVSDPEHPLPFTIAVQERMVVHDLPRILR
jgi:hypothetical protein